MLGSLSWSPWNAVFPVHWLDDEADMREAVAPLFTLQIEPTEQELRGDRPRRVGREGVRRAAIDEAPVAGARAVRRAAPQLDCPQGRQAGLRARRRRIRRHLRVALVLERQDALTWTRSSLWEPPRTTRERPPGASLAMLSLPGRKQTTRS